jgi:hypothetical protein
MITPARSTWSVRRTSTIEMTWPQGPGGPLEMSGRARDLLTKGEAGEVLTLADQRTHVLVEERSIISDLSSDPHRDGLLSLTGAPARSGFRRRLRTLMASELSQGALIYLLLDDIPGATIVSQYALRQWGHYHPVTRDGVPQPPDVVVGLCAGFRPGSSGINPDGSAASGNAHSTVTTWLARPDDPLSWHDVIDADGMTMRRARRLDVRRDGAARLHIDAGFQDSCTMPDGRRSAIHEYAIEVTADAATGHIAAIQATPGNLPFDECPMAAPNIESLVGSSLSDLRNVVPSRLRGIASCTHLNDALRALADATLLARALPSDD